VHCSVLGWVALHGCGVRVSACLIGVWVLFMGAHSGGSLWGLFDAGGMLPQSFFSYLGGCVGYDLVMRGVLHVMGNYIGKHTMGGVG